ADFRELGGLERDVRAAVLRRKRHSAECLLRTEQLDVALTGDGAHDQLGLARCDLPQRAQLESEKPAPTCGMRRPGRSSWWRESDGGRQGRSCALLAAA